MTVRPVRTGDGEPSLDRAEPGSVERCSAEPASPESSYDWIPPDALAFYRTVMRGLLDRGIPYLVGGAYALLRHGGIQRFTRDLDLFVLRETVPAIERAAREMGFEAREFSSHWLWKIETDAGYVDLIWGSGNAAAPVDQDWFWHAVEGDVFGIPARLIPAEEMIWSKSYIQERERFDGADVVHVLERRAETLDWQRLLARFGSHWRVLLGHIVMFGFVYPDHRHRIPLFVMRELTSRLQDEMVPEWDSTPTNLCGGTLLSRSEYLVDLERGYRDSRLPPTGVMSRQQIEEWSRLAELGNGAAIPAPAPATRRRPRRKKP
jgi:hypothetical protein